MRFWTRAVLAAVVALALGAAGAIVYRAMKGASAEQFAYLRAPRIAHLPDQRMLVVEVKGAPSVTSGRAIRTLFKKYYQLPGITRLAAPPAPRARWTGLTAAEGEIVGRFALPVPDTVAPMPLATVNDGLRMGVETWTYGEVAEVLHVGPYNDEAADVARLRAFATAQGYDITGDHEEEYVKGPGVIFAGSAQEYLTILRTNVRQANGY